MIKEIITKIHVRINRHRPLLDVVFLLLLIIYVLLGITLAPFHGDESTYIWMSRDYDLVVKQGNLRSILFDPQEDMGNDDQLRRLSIGSIFIYSIGFARDITGAGNELNEGWIWHFPPGSGDLMWSENIRLGNYPNPLNLTLGRVCSALMGALGIVFLFLAARRLFPSRLPAYVAVLLFATHGAVLLSIRRAMQEGAKFLLIFVTLYLASLVLDGLKQGKTNWILYGLMGLASGLTLATKQDASPVLAAIYLALAFVPIWMKRSGQIIAINFLYLGTATILAYAAFLAFMPIFWGWWETILSLVGFALLLFQLPVLKTGRMAKFLATTGCALVIAMTVLSPRQWNRFAAPFFSIIEGRESLVNGQVNYYVRNELPYLNTLQRKASFLLSTTLTSKVMYMEFTSFNSKQMEGQIEAYESSFLSGRKGAPIPDGLIVILFILGAWALLRRFSPESLLVFLLLTVPAVFLFVFVPLPWQRYFLIMQISYSLIAGVGAGQLWDIIERSMSRRTKGKEPAP